MTSSGHARAASGSRARSTHSSSGHALAAQAAPAHIPRDAAFLVAEQLAQTTISSQQRAVEVKSKRTELQQLLKAQQKSERKAMNAYNGTTTFPQIANLQR